jgi:hypothetical protein
MKVIFKTNIDAYNEKRCFPENLDTTPRKGDFIEVKPQFTSYYRDLKLPIRLEVVDVIWKEHEVGNAGGCVLYETYAFCELWYNSLDLELANSVRAKPL